MECAVQFITRFGWKNGKRPIHKWNRRVAIATCAIVLLFIFLLPCTSSALEAQPAQTIDFNIPPQPLPSALHAFASQTGWEVSTSAELAAERTSPGVKGALTPEDGLKTLLTGTGLTYRFLGPQTVTLENGTVPPVVPPVVPLSEGSSAVPNGTSATLQGAQKPVKVPEIVVKDVKQRDDDAKSYVAEDASTATRTDTPLIEVPQSVEVVTRKVIEDQRRVRIDETLRNVSGVALSVTSIGTANDQVFCRGFQCGFFKNNLRNNSLQQVMTFRDVANVQRLEVLKGPPSVLYGRSEPGGIVNIMTKQPLDEKYASVEQIVGSYSFYRTMMDATGPLNEDKTVLYRINGAYENNESFVDIVHGYRYFVDPVVTWKAGNNTTITFEGEYIKDNRTWETGIPALGDKPASLPISRFLGEPFNYKKVEEYRAGFILNHRFNDRWHIESLFRADRSSMDYLAALPLVLAPGQQTVNRFISAGRSTVTSYQWRNDLIGKVSTGSINHTLLTGVEVGRQNFSSDFGSQFPFTPINLFNPVYGQGQVTVSPTPFSHTFANVIGGYVQDQVDVLDNFHVLVGARGDYLYQHSHFTGSQDTKAENYGFSPRIGVSYQPVRPIALYANVTRSFNPIFGASAVARNQFIPETGTQYEAGIKTDLVPGRLTSTLAIYRLVKRNVLVADPDPARAALGFSVQTGEQRSQGIEFDVTAEVLSGWKIITTYAYTDARITSDTTFQVGNRLPFIARHTGSVWTTYDFQSGPLQGFGAGAGIFAAGERPGDLTNTFELPGYVRADAALYYRKPEVFTHTNLIAQLNVINLLDQQYFYGGTGARSGALPGAPLTFMGSIKLEFY